MHPQLFLFALVAPLALSLPLAAPQGDSGALVARQGSGNSTGGHDGEHYKEKHHGPPGPHPERDLTERQESGNSTGSPGKGGPHDFQGKKHHSGPPHKERDLTERQESGNSTGSPGKGGPHEFQDKKHYGGPPHPERALSERQGSGNSTSSGDDHGDFKHHHEGHSGPKVDKRIEEANGTTGGSPGEGKFKPDGHHGGPQKPGEHKRSIIDTILDRRQDNSTSSGGAGGDGHKHEFGKGHWEHKGPE